MKSVDPLKKSRSDARIMLHDLDYLLAKLNWMRGEHIWLNGLRYFWTNAFGHGLLVSLHRQTGEQRWFDQAEELVSEVERVLGLQRDFASAKRPTAKANTITTSLCG